MADDDKNLYGYSPSPVAALIFAALFAAATLWHIYVVVRRRTWYFIPLIVGGFLEVLGYIFRFLSHNDTDNLGKYILQTVFILIAPSLMAASIYMVLGRLIRLLRAEALAIIRPTWTTKIFVAGDVITFLVQAGGAGMLSNTSSFNTGKTIVLIGLGAQIVIFGLFVVVASVFHYRLARDESPTAIHMDQSVGIKGGWRSIMYALYVASVLIFVRSIVRLAEFSQGHDGTIMTHEVYLYIFDGLLMWGVLSVLILRHPSEYVPGKKKLEAYRNLGYGSEEAMAMETRPVEQV
ncbi:RTA1-domain-containing protein [Thozetella sp. PMI_491]|nr:RTA1-domain-containing protein [Thozetella sp. PMI_491]